MLPISYWIVVIVTGAAVVSCIVLHYEALRVISDRLPGMEAFTGLTFITGSASFTILDMSKTWDDGELDVNRDDG